MITIDSDEERARVAAIDAHRLRLDLESARNDLRIALEDARLARVARDEACLVCARWRARALNAEAVITGLAKLFPAIVLAIRETV